MVCWDCMCGVLIVFFEGVCVCLYGCVFLN